MGKPTGFKEFTRELPAKRDPKVRVNDYKELYIEQTPEQVNNQAARCMDCGVPFCHNGCPLGNLIPEWNDLIWAEKNQKRLIGFMQQIIFQNSLVGFVQHRVRLHALWQLMLKL